MNVRISSFKKGRKAKVEVSSSDTYSLDSTLATIIHPSLVRFKKDRLKSQAVPMDFFDISDPMIRGGYTDEAHKLANLRFEYYLDKMIWAFKEVKSGYPGEENFYIKTGKKKNGLDVFKFDNEGLKQYHARIQEGIDLFAKHFKQLWW